MIDVIQRENQRVLNPDHKKMVIQSAPVGAETRRTRLLDESKHGFTPEQIDKIQLVASVCIVQTMRKCFVICLNETYERDFMRRRAAAVVLRKSDGQAVSFRSLAAAEKAITGYRASWSVDELAGDGEDDHCMSAASALGIFSDANH